MEIHVNSVDYVISHTCYPLPLHPHSHPTPPNLLISLLPAPQLDAKSYQNLTTESGSKQRFSFLLEKAVNQAVCLRTQADKYKSPVLGLKGGGEASKRRNKKTRIKKKIEQEKLEGKSLMISSTLSIYSISEWRQTLEMGLREVLSLHLFQPDRTYITYMQRAW